MHVMIDVLVVIKIQIKEKESLWKEKSRSFFSSWENYGNFGAFFWNLRRNTTIPKIYNKVLGLINNSY